MNALQNITPVLTMSSLELVDLINNQRAEGAATLAHSDFLKKVPQVLGEVAGNFSCYYTASNGKQNPLYRFPKREACLMAMSYSYELQAKVFDRMTELEGAQAKSPAALSRIEILQLAMESEKARIDAEKERDHAIATKAEIGSRREATAMATASARSREVARLQHELGRNQKHATVIAVEKASGRKFAKNAYVELRKVTQQYGLQAVSVIDQRYGSVKAWPAVAWRECFGIDLEFIFPWSEAA